MQAQDAGATGLARRVTTRRQVAIQKEVAPVLALGSFVLSLARFAASQRGKTKVDYLGVPP